MKFTYIGYARVSTEEQNLDLQFAALKQHGCDTIFSDQGISGSCFERPGLARALAALSSGSTLVVWRLDRLGRSIGGLIMLINQLNAQGIEFKSITETIDTTSSSGRFFFHMMAALAEFERSLISERTRAGLTSARARGRRLGRPPILDASSVALARDLLETHSMQRVAQHFNIHVQTLRRALAKPLNETAP
ncbi:DNA resolvase [Burkholderia pyrrocinia]|uniref:recombinase family protein n=1 Tax=Burkholderia stagnalis TaxID=1503054 RepID=UPI0002FB86DB|nr:recombinase family protein [Burkholderia stagnalis]KVN40084.1 DNA resolvase [Burkholderia pyrrocinia]WGS47293.1 recombinase family protein [Burkholderia sp. JSH-S8]